MYPVRDFIYISDAIDGMLKALDNQETFNQTFNLASGNGVNIGDLAEKIVALIDKEVEIVFDATRILLKSQSIQHLVGDISKAEKHLNWQPEISLNKGLRSTIEWFSEHPELIQRGGVS